MKRLFLFDLDGTLVSTGGAGTRALTKAFREMFGVEDVSHKIKFAGKTDFAIFRELGRLVLAREFEKSDLEKIASVYLGHLEREMTVPGGRGAFKGVREFVEHLSRRDDAVLSLGTGNLERGARLKLHPHGLNDFFPDGGFGSDAEDRAELLRVGHRRASARAGTDIPPDQVFVIGDTILDIAAARRAGFRVAAVATGGGTYEQLAAASPDFLMETLLEGFDWLKKLENGTAA